MNLHRRAFVIPALALLLAGCSTLGPSRSGPAVPGGTVVLAHADTVYTAGARLQADPDLSGGGRWLSLLAGPAGEASSNARISALCADPAPVRDTPGSGLWLSRLDGIGIEEWQPGDTGWSRRPRFTDLPAPALLALDAGGTRVAMAWNEPHRLLTCDREGLQRMELDVPADWKRLTAMEFLTDGSLVLADASGVLGQWSPSGELLRQVRQLGERAVRGPLDLCRDPQGGVWMLDGLAGCVWSLDGTLKSRQKGPVVRHLRLPRGLCLDGDGHPVVSLAAEPGLRVYNTAGAVLYRIPGTLAGLRPRLVRSLGPETLVIEDGTSAAPRLVSYKPGSGQAPAPVVAGLEGQP